MDCRSPRVAGDPADVNTGLAGFLAGPSTCPVPTPCVALSMSVVLLGLNYRYKYRLSVKHGGCVYVEVKVKSWIATRGGGTISSETACKCDYFGWYNHR